MRPGRLAGGEQLRRRRAARRTRAPAATSVALGWRQALRPAARRRRRASSALPGTAERPRPCGYFTVSWAGSPIGGASACCRSTRIDDALWRRATRTLPFLPQSQKLKDLALLFLAEKQFAGAHGIEVTDEMRVSIAAQACLPILELGLDWYAGWTGIVVYPGDFRVRRTEVDEDGVVHEWDDELAGEAMPGGPVVISWDAAAHDLAHQRGDPRVRAQARHAGRRRRRPAAAASRHGPRAPGRASSRRPTRASAT